MNETKQFLMPDYFPHFSCKMGACRTACCSGWQVSISLENYFALIGTDCTPELRRKMDCALKPVDYPDDGKYAVIQPNYFGQCPLRLEDGRCGVQAELGEDILPDICRLYPRGVRRSGEGYEISLAASCEAVPEMFLQREEPITFLRREWTMKLPPMPANTLGDWQTRKERIDILQDRTKPLSLRLACLGGVEAGAAEAGTLTAARRILSALSEHSDSIHPYAEEVETYLQNSEPFMRYKEGAENFSKALPLWENFFEHLLVNHLFFTRYPFSAQGTPDADRFASLAVIYAVLRLLAVCSMAQCSSRDHLTDAVAAALRLIEHTDFDRTALYLLHKFSCREQIEKFISL